MCIVFYVTTRAMSTLCPRRSLSLINETTTPPSSLVECSAQILIVKYGENVSQSKLNLKLVREVLTDSWRNMESIVVILPSKYRMKLHKMFSALPDKYLLREEVIFGK